MIEFLDQYLELKQTEKENMNTSSNAFISFHFTARLEVEDVFSSSSESSESEEETEEEEEEESEEEDEDADFIRVIDVDNSFIELK